VAPSIAAAKRLGARITAPVLRFNQEPGYDTDFYINKSKEAIDRFDPDVVQFGDAGGSLTVESVRQLIPAIRSGIGERSLEVSVHCLNAVGPLVALEAAVCGADQLCCSIEPLANGNAGPSAQMLARNLREIGFDVELDDSGLDEIGKYLEGVAQENGFPMGV